MSAEESLEGTAGELMRRDRDVVEEIRAVRSRRRSDSSAFDVLVRLRELDRAFNERTSVGQEFLRHFPVAIVALLETSLRMAIRDLVDSGEPFLSNASNIAPNKLDFSILRALEGKQLSTGELVAHLVSLSSLSQINKAMSALLGVAFLEALTATVDRWDVEVRGKPKVPILCNASKDLANVSRCIDLRHVLCHEAPPMLKVQLSEIEAMFNSVRSFILATKELIDNQLSPDAPLTQAEMNRAAAAERETELQKMREIESRMRSWLQQNQPSSVASFDNANNSMHTFIDHWAAFAASECEGGTIWTTLHSTAISEAAAAYSKRLQQHEISLTYVENLLHGRVQRTADD